MGGRQKELLSNVANSIRVAVKYRARLTDHGHDGARDHVPVRVDVQRHDGLYLKHFLGAVERPCVEIRVALERNADEIGDFLARSSSSEGSAECPVLVGATVSARPLSNL